MPQINEISWFYMLFSFVTLVFLFFLVFNFSSKFFCFDKKYLKISKSFSLIML